MNSPSGYLPTLDGWRAVAISGVVVCHGTGHFFHSSGPIPSPLLYSITLMGSKGVDLFFAISGFLITQRLLVEQRKNGRIILSDFFIRRAFRILPPYLVYLAVLAVGAWSGAWFISRGDFATCLTFTRNYFAPFNDGSWYTGHLWSLSVEEHYYLFWPVLLASVGPRRALGWAVGLTALITVWGMIEFRLQLLPRVLPGVAYYVRTDICIGKLVAGAAFALIVDRYPLLIRQMIKPWLVWPTMLVLGCSLAFKPPLSIQAESLLFPLLILATVLRPETIVGRTLELPPIRWVGRISYSLYLWQQMFTSYTWDARYFPWYLVPAVAIAILSYYLVERPCIRLGHRLTPPLISSK